MALWTPTRSNSATCFRNSEPQVLVQQIWICEAQAHGADAETGIMSTAWQDTAASEIYCVGPSCLYQTPGLRGAHWMSELAVGYVYSEAPDSFSISHSLVFLC